MPTAAAAATWTVSSILALFFSGSTVCVASNLLSSTSSSSVDSSSSTVPGHAGTRSTMTAATAPRYSAQKTLSGLASATSPFRFPYSWASIGPRFDPHRAHVVSPSTARARCVSPGALGSRVTASCSAYDALASSSSPWWIQTCRANSGPRPSEKTVGVREMSTLTGTAPYSVLSTARATTAMSPLPLPPPPLPPASSWWPWMGNPASASSGLLSRTLLGSFISRAPSRLEPPQKVTVRHGADEGLDDLDDGRELLTPPLRHAVDLALVLAVHAPHLVRLLEKVARHRVGAHRGQRIRLDRVVVLQHAAVAPEPAAAQVGVDAAGDGAGAGPGVGPVGCRGRVFRLGLRERGEPVAELRKGALHARVELLPLLGAHFLGLPLEDTDQARGAKWHALAGQGGGDLVVGQARVDPGHLDGAAAEVEEQAAARDVDKGGARAHDGAEQGLDLGGQDVDANVGGGADGGQHLAGVGGAAHGLGGEDGEVGGRDAVRDGDAAEAGEGAGDLGDGFGGESHGFGGGGGGIIIGGRVGVEGVEEGDAGALAVDGPEQPGLWRGEVRDGEADAVAEG
ncbi:hypothetical protein ColKHC_00829 [Colletotrichum higginsianum]|nr:hypothetical protein ColKHC_00829 [Colletotrichum higginsianum]